MKEINSFWRGALLVAVAGLSLACNQPATGQQPASAAANTAASPAPTQNPEDLMLRVRVEDAMKQVKDGTAVIVDVRGTEAYKTAHIKGSLDYPLARLEGKDFKDLPKDKKIIAYCT